jgi:hemerythrin-like domain-containing protein
MPVSSRFGTLEAASLGPTFDEPFEMLEACHERVGRMLDLLNRLRSHLRAEGNDTQAQQAARDVMRYFDTAAPQHHRDEELHVFPVLLGIGDYELVRLVATLQQDHIAMESRWIAVRSLLEEVESGRRRSFNEADDAVLDAFAQLYAGHIEAEEGVAYPRATAAIEPDRLREMSRDMAARRNAR